jgi:hypothetical protein
MSEVPRAEDLRAGLRPETWEVALTLAGDGGTAERPVILVLDEFPYLVAKEPAIEAILQKVWDRHWQGQSVFVLLIGSDEAMMRALTEQGRPLYDRLRGMVVRPLSPAAIGDLLSLDAVDAFDAHLVIGGFPVLAAEWGAGRKLEDYLAEALTDPTSFLVVCGERSLAAEFPAAATRTVLAAIGAGARAHSAILSRTGLAATTINETLETLLSRGAVSRRTPYSTKAARKIALWEIVPHRRDRPRRNPPPRPRSGRDHPAARDQLQRLREGCPAGSAPDAFGPDRRLASSRGGQHFLKANAFVRPVPTSIPGPPAVPFLPMPSSPHKTLMEPGHDGEWARLAAEKRRALTPAPDTPIGQLLRRGQDLSAQAARLQRAVERGGGSTRA